MGLLTGHASQLHTQITIMNGNTEKLGINLLIGNQTHYINVPREKERFFREAAELINERHNLYRQSYSNQSTEKYNALVMLDIAVRYLQLQDANNTQPFVDSLSALTLEIEDALGEPHQEYKK